MFNKFYPNLWVDSVYSVDFASYYREGYRLLLFDIDNTLVCHGKPQTEQSLSFLQNLLDIGFSIRFLSNNKEPRVKSFCEPLKGNVGYIFKAGKPSTRSYLQAINECGESVDTTIFTGDQLFTDVWGANKAGVFSILVKPIDPHEEIQIVLKRILEALVLAAYRHKLNKKSKYGLIGNPVNHSRSPLIHNGLAAMRKDYLTYGLYEVKEENLGRQIDEFKRNNFCGFNVTIPHKTAIIPFLSDISEEAKRIGAVNTVKITKDGLIGINTDYTGLRRDFHEAGIVIKGKDSVILGAGGAAKAVAAMLITEGAKTVFVLNRSKDRAEAFCEEMNKSFETDMLRTLAYAEWNTLPDNLVCVQTTSVGLHGEEAVITDEAFYKKLYAACDIVPVKETDFRRRCALQGINCLDGYGMLVNQAVDAYEFWLDTKVNKLEENRIKGLLKNE